MDDKLLLINNNKEQLLNLIKSTSYDINYNINYINKLQNNYNIFINYIELIKIIKLYEWHDIKNDYILIKKKITKDKKLYDNIIKLYLKLVTYYSHDENNIINTDIKSIYSNIELMNYYYLILQKLNNNISAKINNYIKNNYYIKLYTYNILYNNIFIKLEDIINEFKILDKQIYSLKKKKSLLMYNNSLIRNK